jgi:hypothetical protein
VAAAPGAEERGRDASNGLGRCVGRDFQREGMWNYWSVNELGAMEEICKGIGRKDLVEAFEEIEALMAKEGVCLNYDPVVVVGRKK